MRQGRATHVLCHVSGKREAHPKVFDPVAALGTREVEAGPEDQHEDDVGDAQHVDFRHRVGRKEVVKPVPELLRRPGLGLAADGSVSGAEIMACTQLTLWGTAWPPSGSVIGA